MVIESLSRYWVVTFRQMIATHEIEAVLDEIVGPAPDPVNAIQSSFFVLMANHSLILFTPSLTNLVPGHGDKPLPTCGAVLTHPVLDVVVDDEVQFIIGEAVVFCQDAVDFVDDTLRLLYLE